MDTALPQKFPFILDRNLAKANCTGNRVCTSCDTVVLDVYVYMYVCVFVYIYIYYAYVLWCKGYYGTILFFMVLYVVCILMHPSKNINKFRIHTYSKINVTPKGVYLPTITYGYAIMDK